MLARSELRRRWRGVVVLTLVVGFVGAVVLSTVAGARRTDSALRRFNDFSQSSDLEVQTGEITPAALRALTRRPDVVDYGALRGFFVQVEGARSDLAMAAAIDDRLGTVVDRPEVIAGRRANLAAADEVTIGEALAAQLHVGIGDHLHLSSVTPAQGQVYLDGGNPGPNAGPRVELKVVGIVRRPLDLGDRGAAGGVVVLTPAFAKAYRDRIFSYGTILRVRTRHGAADVPNVVAAARKLFGPSEFGFEVQSLAIESEGARNAIDVLTVALWILAAVAAVAGLVALAIMLTRDVSLGVGEEQATLRALGLTVGQRVAAGGVRVLVIAGAGALLAMVGAILASGIFPIGVARKAEIDPGLRADWWVLGLGLAAVALAVITIGSVAALRASRRPALETASGGKRRTSTTVEIASAAGMPPAATNGLRMALQPGSGSTAVPLRSAFVGAVVGVLGVTAVLLFTASLNMLTTTPRRYGWTWDVAAQDTSSMTCGKADPGIGAVSGVAAVAAVCTTDLEIDGRPAGGFGLRQLDGHIGPTVIDGRAPRGRHEVALGSATMDAVDAQIGDTVTVHGAKAQRMRVVGQVALPNMGEAQALADGAVLAGPAFDTVYDHNNFTRYLLARFTPGADHAAVERRVTRAVRHKGFNRPTGPSVPVEVDHLRQIHWFPITLAALVGGLALLAVGHALVTAVRRRRRELAVLKTLGFERRQVRSTVAWQATTLGVVGLTLGIPAGVIVGNLVWHQVAVGLGVSTSATVPVLALLVIAPVALVLVNVIAFFPAQAAARTRPGVALRTE